MSEAVGGAWEVKACHTWLRGITGRVYIVATQQTPVPSPPGAWEDSSAYFLLRCAPRDFCCFPNFSLRLTAS